MKIAFPTDDGIRIFPHFGRTPSLKIIEVNGSMIVSEKIVSNNFTGHAQGHHQDGEHGHDHSHTHSHSGILNAIAGCEAVIAIGMGRRLLEDFQNANIKAFVTQETNIDKALGMFLSNTLDHNPNSCCSH
jgi:predicted Fe-Mo cluster-binding NifX family protein